MKQVHSLTLTGEHQPSAVACTLQTLIGANYGPDQHLQLWDTKGKTEKDPELVFTFPIGAGRTFSLDVPLKFRRGLFIRTATQPVSPCGALASGADAGTAKCWFTSQHA